MAVILFANNAASTLAGAISPSATECTVASGAGSLFPEPTAGDYFVMTLVDAATGLQNEIVHVTARVGDVMTITRAQEGSAAQSWLAGDLAANLVTAGTMDAMIQQAQLTPVRTVTTSGVFAMTSSDGSILLRRVSAPAVSSTTLPADAAEGQVFWIEDGAKNFNAYNVTVNAPGGMNIATASSVVLNINGQCAGFKYYGGNNWSFNP